MHRDAARRLTHPQLLEESNFWLAQGYVKLEEDDKADKIYNEMIQRYSAAKITRGYFLSRVWHEKGLIAMRQKKYERALDDFAHSEEGGKGKLLSTDQKIDLWIQQSLCYKEMGDTEKAMITLSKAINDDAISALRVKAMFLRAEVYEAQGRHELARRQLEATSKKGGEWALKARQKMEKEYGIR
jgi:tetratricopeptide (TPR) repeat protein